MHKKIIAIISCLSISAFLFGCGSSSKSDTDTTTSNTQSESTDSKDTDDTSKKESANDENKKKDETNSTVSNSNSSSNSANSNNNSSSNDANSTSNPNPSTPVDWNGDFKLKDGNGTLSLVQIDAHTFGYEISGIAGNMPTTAGEAQYSGANAKDTLPDGSTIKFTFNNGTINVVQVKNSQIVFQADYVLK